MEVDGNSSHLLRSTQSKMIKVLSLIKKKWCEDHFIRDKKLIEQIIFTKVSTNAKGNAVFMITQPDSVPIYYELEKIDLSGFSRAKNLSIPKQYRNDFDVMTNKAMIAQWINRYTGHALVEEDISYLVPEKDAIIVVMAPDSMRFKPTSLQLIRL